MTSGATIRLATLADAPALLAIYAPYVQNTAITFEYEVPSLEEFEDRMRHTMARYPYLVAEADGTVLGYAYASSFHEREAYGWGAEVTIYVRQDQQRRGLGRALYSALERALTRQGVLSAYACIAYTKAEDIYLTNNSSVFHEHLGYRLVGRFRKCGYKFNRWYDMVWMEKQLGPHSVSPEPVRNFPEVADSFTI